VRKRSGRPPRYAAVPNETIDDAPSLDFMALALLTILLRHRDGWDITLAQIGAKYGYGRDAMANAMGLLQVARYVVKVRMMSASTNQWSTEVCVYDTPATDEEVAALLAAVSREPGVRAAQVIEPTKAAIAHAAKRRSKLAPKERQARPSVAVPRVPEFPHSGATSEDDEFPQVGPDYRDSRQSGDPAVFKKTVGKKTVDETRDAPSARSAVDERSSSTTGSSAREAEGGSAASSNDHPSPNPDSPRPQAVSKKSSSKAKHTREQLDQVRAVRAFFPADLLNGWTNPSTRQTIPPLPDVPALSQAILDALAGDMPAADRTVEQIGVRIQQRWNEHGWASKFYAGEIDSLVGAAVAMVRPLKSTDRYGCGNPRCDAGKDVDTGVECHVCPERLAARRKARRNGDTQFPGPRPEDASKKWWECEIPTCRKPGPGPRPANGLCPDCDAQLEAAAAALMAVSQAAEPEPASDAGLAENDQEDAGVDEETARLRAMYARQYGNPEQQAAYCTEAPF
jgi:hypothetical protein